MKINSDDKKEPLLGKASISEESSSTSILCNGERGWILAALCGSFVISYIPVSIIISFLPVYIKSRFGITADGNNILFAIWPLLYSITCPFVPKLLMNAGRLNCLVSGFIVLSLSTCWFGMISSWVELYVARAFQGIGSALIAVSCQSILTDTFKDNIGPAMGFRESFIGATFAGAPLVGGVLFEAMGFRKLFLLFGTITLLWALFIYLLLTRENLEMLIICSASEKTQDSPELPSWRFFFQLDVAVAAAVVLFAYFPFGVIQPNLQVHFTQVLQLSPAHIGVFYLIQASVAIFAGPFIGALNKKIDPRRLLETGFTLQTSMFFFFGPPVFLNSLFNDYTFMFIDEISCMLLLGVGAVLLLTSSYCLLSYIILIKPAGSPEVASSIFLCVEGFASTVGPIATSGVMNLVPTSTAPNCMQPCIEAGAEADCSEYCATPFPNTTLVFSAGYLLFTLFLFYIFRSGKVHYQVGDPVIL